MGGEKEQRELSNPKSQVNSQVQQRELSNPRSSMNNQQDANNQRNFESDRQAQNNNNDSGRVLSSVKQDAKQIVGTGDPRAPAGRGSEFQSSNAQNSQVNSNAISGRDLAIQFNEVRNQVLSFSQRPLSSHQKDQQETNPGCLKWTFLISSIVFIIFGGLKILEGEPSKLSLPVDPDGKTCGVYELQEYPSIYFPTPSKKYMNRSVCVKSCPDLVTAPKLGQKLDCYPNSVVTSCEFKLQHGDKRDKEFLIYDTTLYNKNVCMPKNVKYFGLVTEAIKGNIWQQSLKSMRQYSVPILLFSIGAMLICFIVKCLIDSESNLPKLITCSYVICVLGFLFLGALFAYRGVTSSIVEEVNRKKVVEDDEVLTDIAEHNDSNQSVNFVLAVLCVFAAIYYLWKNPRSKSREDKVHEQMLNYVPNIMKDKNLIKVPIWSIIISFLLFIFTFSLQTNLQSIGSIDLKQNKDLPFQRFGPSIDSKILAIVFCFSFAWIISYIMQVAQYIALVLSYWSIAFKLSGQESMKEIDISNQLTEIRKFRIGTLAFSSLIFFLQPIRTLLETIETNLQKETDESRERERQTIQEVNEGRYKQAKRKVINSCYAHSFLKKCQNYGYLITHLRNKEYLDAGKEMQDKIDTTSFWFEEILEKGENFESHVKYTISFLVVIIFSVTVFATEQNTQNLVPAVILMIASSLLVSQFFIGTYASVYASMILFPVLVDEYDLDRVRHLNSESLQTFEKYINQLVSN